MIDLSLPSVSIGLTQQMIASLRSISSQIPDNFLVGLMTMSDTINFFNFADNTELIIPDLSDPAYPKSLIFEMGKYRNIFLQTLDLIESRSISQIPASGHCIGNALQAAESILFKFGGILIIGFSDLPCHGPYPLKNRVLTEKSESDLLHTTKDQIGKSLQQIARSLTRAGVSVHLFSAGSRYADFGSIAIFPGFTGGSIHIYQLFDEAEKSQFHNDLFSTITNEYGFSIDAKFRTSKQLRIRKYAGNFAIMGDKTISCPAMPIQNCYFVEFEVENPISASHAHIQLSFCFTNKNRQRILRVLTFSLPTSNQIEVIKNSVDELALISQFQEFFLLKF